MHTDAHGKSFICRRKPAFLGVKEQSIIFEGFRNGFVLQAPSQSPCISLGHNLKHPLLDSEQTGVLWILDSKGSLGISSKHRASHFLSCFLP